MQTQKYKKFENKMREALSDKKPPLGKALNIYKSQELINNYLTRSSRKENAASQDEKVVVNAIRQLKTKMLSNGHRVPSKSKHEGSISGKNKS